MQRCLSSTFVFRTGLFFCFFQIVSGNQKPLGCMCVGLRVSAFELCEQPQLLASLPRPSSSVPALSGLGVGGRRILPRWTKKTPPRWSFPVRPKDFLLVRDERK